MDTDYPELVHSPTYAMVNFAMLDLLIFAEELGATIRPLDIDAVARDTIGSSSGDVESSTPLTSKYHQSALLTYYPPVYHLLLYIFSCLI